MRISIFTLFVSAGTAAFCQSGTPLPAMPEQQVLPPITILPFNSAPREFHLNPDLPRNFTIQEKTLHRSEPQIDSRMVVHPPPSSVGEQAPGTLVAQNLYPGLQLLPIAEPGAAAQPIPVTWPELKMQNIPTDWAKLAVKTVQKGAKTAEK